NDPYMDSNISSAGGMTNKDIENMNQHEIAWLLSQNQVFRDSYQVEKDFQAVIDHEKKKRGASFPVLDIALGTYDTALKVAQSVHDQAAKTIGAQWGFDAQGHVTNRDAALQTVMNARYSLRDAHYRMVISTHKLHRAYADWHKQFAPR
ncbi:MAG: hypothetical protein WA821_20675, partial [Anaerolineales bacterium]